MADLMMATPTPVQSQILCQQLFEKLCQTFPEVPQDIIKQQMHRHGNDMDNCMDALKQESERIDLYGNTHSSSNQPNSDPSVASVTRHLNEVLYIPPNRQRSQSGGSAGRGDDRPRSGSGDSRTSDTSIGSGAGVQVNYSTTYTTKPQTLMHSQSVQQPPAQYKSTHEQIVNTPPETAPARVDFAPFMRDSPAMKPATVPQTGCRIATPPPLPEQRFQITYRPHGSGASVAASQNYNNTPSQSWATRQPSPGGYYPYHQLPPNSQPSSVAQPTFHYNPQGVGAHNPGANVARPETFPQGFPPSSNGGYSSPATSTPSPHSLYLPSPVSPASSKTPPHAYNSIAYLPAPQHGAQGHGAQGGQHGAGAYVPPADGSAPTLRFHTQHSAGSQCSGSSGTPPKSLQGPPEFPSSYPRGQYNMPLQAWNQVPDLISMPNQPAPNIQQPIQPVSYQGGASASSHAGGIDLSAAVSASMPPMELERQRGRSGSLSEQQQYTQALLMYQRARMEKLLKDCSDHYIILDRLRKEIAEMEQSSLTRRQARNSSFPTADDVHKMREQNRRLQIDIQLLTHEKDMLDSGDSPLGILDPKNVEGFYTNIQSGQRGSIHSSGGESIASASSRMPPPRPPPPLPSHAPVHAPTHPPTHPPAPPLHPAYPPATPPHSSYPPATPPHSSYPPATPPHAGYPPATPPHSGYPGTSPHSGYSSTSPHLGYSTTTPPPLYTTPPLRHGNPPMYPVAPVQGAYPLQQTANPPSLVTQPSTETEDADEEEGWSCSMCTFRNHPALEKCEICEMPHVNVGTQPT